MSSKKARRNRKFAPAKIMAGIPEGSQAAEGVRPLGRQARGNFKGSPRMHSAARTKPRPWPADTPRHPPEAHATPTRAHTGIRFPMNRRRAKSLSGPQVPGPLRPAIHRPGKSRAGSQSPSPRSAQLGSDCGAAAVRGPRRPSSAPRGCAPPDGARLQYAARLFRTGPRGPEGSL